MSLSVAKWLRRYCLLNSKKGTTMYNTAKLRETTTAYDYTAVTTVKILICAELDREAQRSEIGGPVELILCKKFAVAERGLRSMAALNLHSYATHRQYAPLRTTRMVRALAKQASLGMVYPCHRWGSLQLHDISNHRSYTQIAKLLQSQTQMTFLL